MGEIDLLTRLQKVDRVIQLFDHEMNDEKHTLSLVRPRSLLFSLIFPQLTQAIS